MEGRKNRVIQWLVLVCALSTVGAVGCSRSGSPSSGRLSFTNPDYPHNFADPFVLRVGHTYYAYATGTCNYDLQVIHSTDLVHWSSDTDALPRVSSWSQNACDNSFFYNRLIWAPEVLRVSDSKYALYYATRWVAKGIQCVSYASSTRPGGPFVDRSKKPFVCHPEEGGSIDPDVFRDRDGTLYLLWKNDANAIHSTTYIYSQHLALNGTSLLGKPTRLVSNDKAWEGALIEAPTMWRHGSSYYLFYSANGFNTTSYAVGYATCKSPSGPCKDAPENPILHSPPDTVLSSTCKAAGPGHQALFTDRAGQTWIAYHAWHFPDVGDSPNGPGRQLYLDRVDWNNGKPVIHGPTCTPQRAPSTT